MSRADRASERRSETRPALQRKRRPTIKASSGTPLVFGHFRRGTSVKPEVDAWIAAQRLAFWRHLPQREGAIASATAAWAILLDRSAVIGKCPNYRAVPPGRHV